MIAAYIARLLCGAAQIPIAARNALQSVAVRAVDGYIGLDQFLAFAPPEEERATTASLLRTRSDEERARRKDAEAAHQTHDAAAADAQREIDAAKSEMAYWRAMAAAKSESAYWRAMARG